MYKVDYKIAKQIHDSVYELCKKQECVGIEDYINFIHRMEELVHMAVWKAQTEVYMNETQTSKEKR